MIYICVPYAHPSMEIRTVRVDFARAYSARLFECGQVVICPLVMRDSLAHYMRDDVAAKDWQGYCRSLMRFASEVVIAKLDGWSQDPDVRDAMRFAAELHIPLRYIDPSIPDKTLALMEMH